MIWLTNKIERALSEASHAGAPSEVVGLILSNESVVTLPNIDPSPGENFQVRKSDIISYLEKDPNPELIVLWHSHPNGGVGPSKIDMRNKTPFKHHLVVSLTSDDIICSWY